VYVLTAMKTTDLIYTKQKRNKLTYLCKTPKASVEAKLQVKYR